MNADMGLWGFILNASLVVKFVLFLLVLASVFSWMLILQRRTQFKQTLLSSHDFEKRFWSGGDLREIFQQVHKQPTEYPGLGAIFQAGFMEFQRMQARNSEGTQKNILNNVSRAMRIAYTQEMDKLEHNLGILATIGSISPYVGLFGTVWGIMTAFQSLGTVQQATIAMVAPGISEALIATAIGLFAAIPAVIAYNRFTTELQRFENRCYNFQEGFLNLLHRNFSNTAEE